MGVKKDRDLSKNNFIKCLLWCKVFRNIDKGMSQIEIQFKKIKYCCLNPTDADIIDLLLL